MKKQTFILLLSLFWGIHLQAQNNPPTVTDLQTAFDYDESVNIDLSMLVSDPDGDTITYSIITQPVAGSFVTVDSITGMATVYPSIGFSGFDSFEYRACDDGEPSLCGEQSINFEVLIDSFTYKYWILLTDKNDSPYSIEEPSEFLSPKSIERRSLQGIAITEQDLPVNPNYIENILAINEDISFLHMSKWFNAVAVEFTASDKQIVEDILALDFTQEAVLISAEAFVAGKTQSLHNEKTESIEAEIELLGDEEFYGASFNQIDMLEGDVLHLNGYTGSGIIIGVLDSGFRGIDTLDAFQHLFNNGQFLGGKDVVNLDESVFDSGSHGSQVLSSMAAYLPNEYVGAAPDAQYLLMITEAPAERRIEEINWIVGAEFADSAGADILTTSLGYSDFDGVEHDYTYEDMDGETTFISRGSDIAASKGMLIVASAGNQGNKEWQYITAPADGDNVLSVGSVNSEGSYSSFSSHGPSSDQQVKPEVTAQGEGTALIHTSGSQVSLSGTSFSGPLIAGLAACLWQSNPEKSALEIRQAIIESASQYATPDSLLGHGIPNFETAFNLINTDIPLRQEPIQLLAYPNPFYQDLEVLVFTEEAGDLTIQLVDVTGRLLYERTEQALAQRLQRFHLNPLNQFPKGVYFLRLSMENFEEVLKVSKLEE